MVTLLYIVTLVLLLKPVWAGGRAGGYERLWIWYAYRIDQLNPQNQRAIATGCRTGSGDPIGFCYFTELMEYIDSPRTFPSWFNNPAEERMPANPKNLSPDMSVAENMYQRRQIPERFTPNNVLGRGAGGYAGMLNRIANVIKDTRESLSPEDLERHKDLFNTADECLRKSIGWRRRDMHLHMDDKLRRPGSGVQDIVVRFVPDPEFGGFLNIAGAANDPLNRGRPNVDGRLNNWIHNNYIVAPGTAPTTTEQTHWGAIQQIRQARRISHESCGGNI